MLHVTIIIKETVWEWCGIRKGWREDTQEGVEGKRKNDLILF